MRDILPQRLATLLQPYVQGIEALGLGDGLPQPMAGILHLLLDLPLLPTCRRITELGFEQVMADHRQEAGVDDRREGWLHDRDAAPLVPRGGEPTSGASGAGCQ